MRDTTERPEAVESGTVNKKLIVSEVTKLIENSDYYNKMSKANNPYGDGKVSGRILRIIGSK